MTIQEEQPFCQKKGKYLIFLNIPMIIRRVLASPRLSRENITNAITVARDCWASKSDSWLIKTYIPPKSVAFYDGIFG